jgi:hypothetical protein
MLLGLCRCSNCLLGAVQRWCWRCPPTHRATPHNPQTPTPGCFLNSESAFLFSLLLQGFTNAKWVEGELLVFGGDSPFVRGAQLGFTFDVRANQR